ncbi:YebC/PmpR family DNA-binding transcriptional regulator [Candidatus Chlorohelix sp.]|uniref:YebC/PmpR family DNA-binding transcriptional regulator n=1 Tax=Candidatus Chlorohelix sp. TaxID=3139201 RepID=UPI0030479C0B
MSGHSKWHSIRRSKAIIDNKRGAAFTKLAREISIAAREGGGADPDTNFKLRVAIQKARAENMPVDNIKRAVEKGMGGGEGGMQLEEIFYEGYGAGGAAVLVQALTDNRNRTSSEVRSAFTKGGGNHGEPGSVSWMFEHVGLIRIELGKYDPEELMLIAIDAGASDVQEVREDDEVIELEVYTGFEDMRKVQEALEKGGIKIISSEAIFNAKTTMDLDDAKALQVLRLMERLEDLDDVQNVYSNLNIRDEVAALQ